MAQQLRGTHTAQSLLNIYFSMCGTQRLEVSPHVHKRGKRLLVSFFFPALPDVAPPPTPGAKTGPVNARPGNRVGCGGDEREEAGSELLAGASR